MLSKKKKKVRSMLGNSSQSSIIYNWERRVGKFYSKFCQLQLEILLSRNASVFESLCQILT